MDFEGEQRFYGDSTVLEPILEQQDDEITTSLMSSSSIDASFVEDERRVRDEIQQFEDLEKEFASHRHGIRVKFDDEKLPSMSQTTLVKTEPYFQINAIEDQVTKHFYENEPINQSFKRNLTKSFSEADSLDEELNPKNFDQITSSSPGKSILKKSSNKQQRMSTRSSSPASSSSSVKKKPTTSSPSNSNEMLHLAEVTAKVTSSRPSTHLRSLFEPTINIFDSSRPNASRRPSRLQYYVKPYRGDVYIPPESVKRRSRSLSEQRLAQQQGPTVWYTFSNQYQGPIYRKQHVSWSPVRAYIHQGRDSSTKPSMRKSKIREPSPSLLSTLSSSSPNLRSTSHLSPASIDSYETTSMSNYSLTPMSQNEERKDLLFPSPIPQIAHPTQTNQQHSETMQRYDRLLEKMRQTDQQLQSLSRSWINSTSQPKTIIKTETRTKNNEFISPIFLQTCLLILVLFNLLVVYFFNDINIFWSRYISDSSID